MENKEFSKKLEVRTKAFAIRIIRLSSLLPNRIEEKVIRNQMTKAGTSNGVILKTWNLFWLKQMSCSQFLLQSAEHYNSRHFRHSRHL